MNTSCSLDKDKIWKFIEEHKYRGMICFRLYFTTSYLDIVFHVCMCAHFQANPKESHLIALKCIMMYLTSTPLISLWYSNEIHYALVEYFNYDFAG